MSPLLNKSLMEGFQTLKFKIEKVLTLANPPSSWPQNKWQNEYFLYTNHSDNYNHIY